MKKILLSLILTGIASSAMAQQASGNMQANVQAKFQSVQPQLATAAQAKLATMPAGVQAQVATMQQKRLAH
jgi:Skp family chaperone for outer membrane proteins